MVLDLEAYKPDIHPLGVAFLDGHNSPREQLSVTGRSTVPIDPDYERLANAIQHDALRLGRRVLTANHNAVDIARIQAGIDVRTTVSDSLYLTWSQSLNNYRLCFETSPTVWTKAC